LPQAALITGAEWQGGYFLPPLSGPPSITAFTLTFWSDVGGQPGSPLMSYFIPGTANETFVGPGPGLTAGGNLIFDYQTDLPTPFLAQGGVIYWLSIVPDLVFQQNPPITVGQWGWHTGTGGDGISMQDFLGTRFTNPNDLAFTLTGEFIPEPASIVLWGIGVAALGYGWRRRQALRAAANGQVQPVSRQPNP
jgi:hypothetical protein